jgi:hypothetical protein
MVDSLVLIDTQGGSRVVPGSVAGSVHLDEKDTLYLGLFKYHNRTELKVHFARDEIVGTAMLSPVVELHDFTLLDGKRLTPTARSRRNTAGSSLIQFRHEGEAFVEKFVKSYDTFNQGFQRPKRSSWFMSPG